MGETPAAIIQGMESTGPPAPVMPARSSGVATCSSAVIVGLVYRPRQRLLRMMSLVSFALAAVYLINLIVLLRQGS